MMEHFNSRPHEEVDPELKNHNHLKGISTHDLTRRSTLIRITFLSFSVFQLTTSRGGRPVYTNQLFKQSNISTHDLTRRSTYIDLVLMLFGIYFNSRPHEEVDLIQRLVWTLVIHFNSRPHEEVDRRYGNPYRYLDISTHDLTRRSTAYEKVRSIVSNISTHDLTRRSTAVFNTIIVDYFHFNSRPHEEVDVQHCKLTQKYINISTHDLTRRSTRFVRQSG